MKQILMSFQTCRQAGIHPSTRLGAGDPALPPLYKVRKLNNLYPL